jgi:hypothetical protein
MENKVLKWHRYVLQLADNSRRKWILIWWPEGRKIRVRREMNWESEVETVMKQKWSGNSDETEVKWKQWWNRNEVETVMKQKWSGNSDEREVKWK